MTTTISLTSKRQCVLPKEFCDRAGLTPGAQLRATEINGGLYISPIPEPTEAEFRRVLKLADTGKQFTQKDAKMLDSIIKKHRAKKQSRS